MTGKGHWLQLMLMLLLFLLLLLELVLGVSVAAGFAVTAGGGAAEDFDWLLNDDHLILVRRSKSRQSIPSSVIICQRVMLPVRG